MWIGNAMSKIVVQLGPMLNGAAQRCSADAAPCMSPACTPLVSPLGIPGEDFYFVDVIGPRGLETDAVIIGLDPQHIVGKLTEQISEIVTVTENHIDGKTLEAHQTAVGASVVKSFADGLPGGGVFLESGAHPLMKARDGGPHFGERKGKEIMG
jgi:hypothetical protein